MSEHKHLTLEQLAKSLRNSTCKSTIEKDKTNFKSINLLPFLPPPPLTFFSIDQKTGKLSQQYNECLSKYNERLEYILNDLDLLLKFPIKTLVNQIMNDKSFVEFYSSFLKYSPRPYELELNNESLIPEDINLIIFSIKKNVFMILHRLSIELEEMKSNENTYLSQLYSSYLFELPNLFDLCVLFEENESISKLISNVIRKNANDYKTQFKKLIPNMMKVFKSNETQLQNIFELNSNLLKQNYLYRSESHDETLQLLNYFIDIIISLSLFTNITPIISNDLLETNFHNSLIEFIEHTIYEIEDILMRSSRKENNSNIHLVTIKIQILKYELVKFVDRILDQCIIVPISEKNYDSSHLELFYHSYLHLLDYKKFLTYYIQNFDVMGKLNRLFKASKDKIDQCQFDFIMDNIKAVIQEDKQNPQFIEYNNVQSQLIDEKIGEIKTVDNQYDDVVESLLDIFPEYTKVFIKECLEYFDNNKEQLINAILENNLPKDLQNKIKPSFIENEKETAKNKTIFDGDQFDISNKGKIDYSRIHIGKRNTTDNLLINEPISKVKFDYQNQLSNNDNEYDDEYDDTYDDKTDLYQDASAFDIKPLNEKIDAKKREYFEKDEEEEAENQSVAGNSGNNNQPQPQRVRNSNFVEDPAMIRERQQARYEARQAEYAARKWNKPPSNNDNPEDEEAKIQRDRKYKNENKAQIVHHNRRNLAARKQNRGLLD